MQDLAASAAGECPASPSRATCHSGPQSPKEGTAPASRVASSTWLSDSYSDGPPAVTLRQNIALLARLRGDPVVAQIRRQRQTTRIWGSLGGWLCVGGAGLCLIRQTPDSAGFVALAVGVGCTVGGMMRGVDTIVYTLCLDSPQRAARRHDRQMLLSSISDQLPLDDLRPRAQQRTFQALVEVTHRLCSTLAMDAHELSREVAQEALRGCLFALVAGFAGACLTPLLGRLPAVGVALGTGALPLGVAIAQRWGLGGSWQRLRALGARPSSDGQHTPKYGVSPDLILPVQLHRGEVERLFGAQDSPAEGDQPDIEQAVG